MSGLEWMREASGIVEAAVESGESIGAMPLLFWVTDNTLVGSDEECGDKDTTRDVAECIVDYIVEIEDSNIIIYLVALNDQVDIELMSEIANITGGATCLASRVCDSPDDCTLGTMLGNCFWYRRSHLVR